MADNIAVNNDDSTLIGTLAADDISSILYPRTKLVHGADGVNDGDVSTANPLPVDLREAGGNSLTTGAGAVASGTPRVTLALDDPGVALLATIDADTGSMATLLGTIDTDTSALAGCVGGTEIQVDIVASLPAGTNAIGKLAANTGVDIGDVDVTSVVPGTAATSLGKAEDAAHTTGDVGVMALAVRTDLPVATSGTDGDYNALQVDASGYLWTRIGSGAVDVNSVVTGTGPTNLGKAEDAAHSSGDTGVAVLAVRRDTAAVSSTTDGDYSTLNVDASGRLWSHDPVAEALLTTIDADTGNAVTSLQLIDDAVYTDATGTPSKGIAVMGTDGTNPQLIAVDSSGNVQVDIVSSSLALETGGNLDAAATSLAIMDDWDETNRCAVNLIASQAGITAGAGAVAANTPRMTLASDDPAVALLNTIDADTGNITTAVQLIDDTVVADDAAFTPGTTKVIMSGFEADESSTDSVDEGDGGAARMTLDRKQIVTVQPHTTGGLSIFRSLDLDETEEDVKTSAGQVYGWYIFNAATTERYVKFYNATAANVTVGSTTPVMTLPIPAATDGGVGFIGHMGGLGIAFNTAISVAATTGLADADTGAPSANDVVIQVFYA